MLAFSWHGMGWIHSQTSQESEKFLDQGRQFTDAKGGMSGDFNGILPSKIGIENDMMGTLKVVGNH